MSTAVQHLQKIRRRDHYGTVQEKFDEACKNFKLKLKVDYTASDINHVLDIYLTEKDNALLFQWRQDGFGNFPYSLQYEFMEKMTQERKKYNITMLILCYVKTDTKWWNRFVYDQKKKKFLAEFHPIEGRLKFKCRHGFLKSSAAPYPSCWLVYRKQNVIFWNLKRFYRWAINLLPRMKPGEIISEFGKIKSEDDSRMIVINEDDKQRLGWK